jgi:hypothetical protein
MDLLLYLLGGALIAVLVRWWRPQLPRRWAAGYLLGVAVFFAAPLATSSIQVPGDLAYQWRPWRETIPPAELGRRPSNELLSDIPLQMLPFRALVRDRLLRGAAPLWAHELATGQPLLGNAQSAPFAPLHLLALARPPVRALTLAVAWQILLGLLLAHALLAALGAGAPGSALGAVAFAFSAYAICWAYHPLGMTTMWVPGVLLGLVALRRGERGGFAGLVACGLGLATSGHPETIALTALAAAVTTLLLVRPRRPPEGWPPRWRFLLVLAAAAGLTACLAAPALLPVLEALPESARTAAVAHWPDSVEPPPFAPRVLLTAIDPLIYGSPRDGNWDGPANFNELCSGYAGLLPLALAVAAAAALRGRFLVLLGGGLAALLAAMRVPPFFALAAAIPGFEHAAHARLRLLWVLAVAVAAGLGLEELLRRRSGRAAAAAAIAAAIAALACCPPPRDPWQRAWWIGALAGAALALAAFALPRLRAAAPWIVGAGLVVDLALLNGRYLPVLPARFDLAPPPAAAYLAAQTSAAATPFRVIAEGPDLMPNLGALYGLWDPRGDDPMEPAAAALVVGRSFHPRYQVGRLTLLAAYHYPQPMLDYLGVRFTLVRHRRRLYPPWEPAWDGQGGLIGRNAAALPLFFMPARVVRAPGAAAALAATLANGDFAATAVVAGPPRPGGASGDRAGSTATAQAHAEPAPQAAAPPAAGAFVLSPPQRGKVEITRVLPNGFELVVDSPTGGLVASSVSHARGWKLWCDGRPLPVLRVNSGFLGLPVPAGRHRLLADFRPDSWIWGLRLCGLGAAGALLGMVGAGVARRRRRAATRRAGLRADGAAAPARWWRGRR